MSKKAESKLVDEIITGLKREYGSKSMWVKIHGGMFQTTGLPDIVGCRKGRFVGIEVKLPSKEHTLTERQKLILERIQKAGGISGVVTNLKEAVDLCHSSMR